MGPSLHLEVSRKADVWRYPILLRLACHTDARKGSRPPMRRQLRMRVWITPTTAGYGSSTSPFVPMSMSRHIDSAHCVTPSNPAVDMSDNPRHVYTVDAALMSIIGGRGFYVPCFANNAKPQQLCKFHYKLRQILNNRTGTH